MYSFFSIRYLKNTFKRYMYIRGVEQLDENFQKEHTSFCLRYKKSYECDHIFELLSIVLVTTCLFLVFNNLSRNSPRLLVT